MVWTFELYRILTAQWIAQAQREAEGSHSVAPASGRLEEREAAPARPFPWIARAPLRKSILSLVHAGQRGLGRCFHGDR
jgi:hypothetical protein